MRVPARSARARRTARSSSVVGTSTVTMTRSPWRDVRPAERLRPPQTPRPSITITGPTTAKRTMSDEAGDQEQQQAGDGRAPRQDAREDQAQGRESPQDRADGEVLLALLVDGDDAVDDAGEEDQAEHGAGDAERRAGRPQEHAEDVRLLGVVGGRHGRERHDEVDRREDEDGGDHDPPERAAVGAEARDARRSGCSPAPCARLVVVPSRPHGSPSSPRGALSLAGAGP